MESFFNRLETYVDVRPSTAMKDIIVKIMVEVLSILGIVTKEIKQGRTSMSFLFDISPQVELRVETYLKKLIGRKDIEEALQRLEQLIQEETRMAAAEILTIARGIDDQVQHMGEKVESVDVRVGGIDGRMNGIHHVVEDLDHKVGSVVKGESSFHQPVAESDLCLLLGY